MGSADRRAGGGGAPCCTFAGFRAIASGDDRDGMPERCIIDGDAIDATAMRRGPSWTRPAAGAASPARAAANSTLFR